MKVYYDNTKDANTPYGGGYGFTEMHFTTVEAAQQAIDNFMRHTYARVVTAEDGDGFTIETRDDKRGKWIGLLKC